jgi:outer membrane protein assembly factor BamB
MFSLGSILSSPAVAGGLVFVGSTDGNLYALR